MRHVRALFRSLACITLPPTTQHIYQAVQRLESALCAQKHSEKNMILRHPGLFLASAISFLLSVLLPAADAQGSPEVSYTPFRNFPARLFFFNDATVRSFFFITDQRGSDSDTGIHLL